MLRPSWRTGVRRLAASFGRAPRARPRVALGRNNRLEERFAPALLTASAMQAARIAVSPVSVTRKVREGPAPVLSAPEMPGLAGQDAALGGAIRRAWEVPTGTSTAQWVMGLAPGQDPQAVAGPGARVTATPYLPDTYVVEYDAPRPVTGAEAQFQRAAFYYPLVPRQQVARFIPNDPLFTNQWHLRNVGQTGGLVGADARVTPVWDAYTGAGVTIGIVDDGLDHTHPDLSPNYVAADSFDFNDFDSDPAPRPLPAEDWHGTAVAGVAAGRGNNGIGVSGAAPNASLAGLRLIAGFPFDQDEANALSYHRDNIDIYSNSWGPTDNGTLGPIGPLALAAIQSGATSGRNGLGNIYVWAAGNGREWLDNVNYDGYANSRFVVAVGAIDHKGKVATYSEPGAAMLVTACSNSFAAGAPGITTTDVVGSNGYNASGDYTNDFGGTSSATPLVSGVIALMLQANPNLTSRDVQNILVRSARMNDPGDAGWTTNAAGFHINHNYGFGAIDAEAAVALARDWERVKPELTVQGPFTTVNRQIPDNNATGVSSSVALSTNIQIEHVEVVFNASHPFRGDLEVVLTAPSGTKSVLAAEHITDGGTDYTDWVFSTVRDWGETSAGVWTLTVRDRAGRDVGTFQNWQLRVYGTEIPPTVSELEATALSVLENQSVALTDTLAVADLDSPTMSGARVSFVAGTFAPGEDVLTFTPQGAITGSYNAASGTLTLSGPGSAGEYQDVLRSVRYTNSSDDPASLVRTISFRVTDSGGNTSVPVSRTLSVTPVNDPPTFTLGPDITVDEDAGPQSFLDWATNVTAVEASQTKSLEIVENSNPSLFASEPVIIAPGALAFVTALNAFGTASIQIRARDDGGTANGGEDVSATQTFTITVNPVNDPATGNPDRYTLPEDQVLSVPAPGVLVNDRDPEGDALSAVELTGTLHGVLTLNSDGSFTYVPAPNFSGTDAFTYQLVESGGESSSRVTVTLRVASRNDAPVASGDFAASNGHPVTINVLANDTDVDGDVLRVGSYTRPTLGRVSRLGGSLVYTPLPGAVGTDTFSYTVVDAAGATDTATVTVDVTDATPPEVRSVRITHGKAVANFATPGRSVLPWANITKFEAEFSEDVTVDATALTLTGALGGDVPLTFSYNAATRTATWSSATALAIDRYTLRLSAATVLDGSGNPLRSDWARALGVLPGDFDGNGFVDAADLTGIRKHTSRPRRPLNSWADVTGDGRVGPADLTAAAENVGKRV